MGEPAVDELMSQPVESVRSDTPIATAAETLISNDVGAVVVTDDEGLEGLLTATDFVLLARDGNVPADARVSEFMRTEVITTKRSTPVEEAAELMLDHLIHHLPVVDDEEVVGMITTLDITAHLARSGGR